MDQIIEDAHTRESFGAGSFPRETESGSLTAGNLKRGCILERGGTQGDWVECTVPANAEGILADDTDASGAAQAIVVLVSGKYDEDGGTLNWNVALGPAAGPINDATRAALKANNLYLG